MNKSIVKQFADFKIRHSLSNDIIKEMLIEYADSELDLARSYFSKKYNISNNTFYKARDYAVICCLIDEATCKKVKAKTVANYKRNNPNKTVSGPLSHFSTLCIKRLEFLNTFSNNEIIDIANKYVEGISIKNIAFAYDIGEYGIKLLLRKGIIFLIINKETTETIKLMLKDGLNKILVMREYNKQIILDCIEKEISCLNFQIEYYDLYYRNEKEKPLKDTLQKRLTYVLKRKEELLRY